jgi:hypothetical protein
MYRPNKPMKLPVPRNLVNRVQAPPLGSVSTAAIPPLKKMLGVLIFPNIYITINTTTTY